MRGHIQLGLDKDDMWDFLLADPTYRIRTRVNPLAAKIGQGASQYNDYTSYEFWAIENWGPGIGTNAGVGIDGGYLYGEVDSRAGESFILPPLLTVTTDKAISDTSPPVVNIGDGIPVKIDPGTRVAIKFYRNTTGPLFVYGDMNGVVLAAVHADAAGEPGAALWTGTASSNEMNLANEWVQINVDFVPVAGTPYWLVLSDDSTEMCLYGMAAGLSGDILVENGTWSDTGLKSPYISGGGNLGMVIAAQTVGDDLFTVTDDGKVRIYNSGTGTFDLAVDLALTCYDMQLWYDKLIVSHGSSSEMTVVDLVSYATTSLTVFGTVLSVWNGFLWKSYGNVASYSGDNITTWIDVEVGPTDYPIISLTGLGDDVLVSTAQAIWRIAPGDWVFGVSKWAYQSDNNGVNAINNQGSAYAPAENALIFMQPNAPMLNIWNRDEPLPGSKAGIVSGVIGTNKEVIVSIDPAATNGNSTCWSFNNQGWHFVCNLPAGQKVSRMHYDSSNDRIWIFSDSGHAHSFYASSTASSPLTDTLTEFRPSGHVDMGNFHGGLQTIIKDFDSVQVIGENISPSRPVTIFWRMTDGGDTEDIYQNDGEVLQQNDGEVLQTMTTGWSELGTIVETGGRLRWTDWTIRPVGVGIRLAYSIGTSDVSISPKIDAVVVKYHGHVVDQFRWQLPITASDHMEMVDMSKDDRTGIEIMAQLESLEIDRYLPIWFKDVDNRLYECKVLGFSERLTIFEKIKGSDPRLVRTVDLDIQEIAAEESP